MFPGENRSRLGELCNDDTEIMETPKRFERVGEELCEGAELQSRHQRPPTFQKIQVVLSSRLC